jgi:hypothetical protein
MARKDLPPPLPPETRTVGQLVGEAIRLYGRRLVPSLAIGLLATAWASLPRLADEGTLILRTAPLLGAALLSAAYVCAVALHARRRVRIAPAFAAGMVVFVPFQLLLALLVFPAIVWLAAVGLAVPVLALERRGFIEGFRRAFTLARADFVHALGSLAALAIVVAVATVAMAFVLRDFGDQAVLVASLIAWAIMSPLFFLGAALLYYDQVARAVDSAPPTTRRSNADLHHALDADRPGRPDAEVESGAAARGEP